MPSTRISVVMPTMNRGKELEAFLASLCAQTVTPGELVVVDAGEPVEALLRAGLQGSGIRLVYERSEPGTSLQRNVGIGLSTGEFLFFLDDDMVLEPDYFERTMEAFELDADVPVGAVMGTVTNLPADSAFKAKILGLMGISHVSAGDDSKLYMGGGVRWLTDPSRPVFVPAVATGRVAYRRECLEQEAFSEFLPGYTFAEDVELAFRVGRRWSLVHQPAARLEHRHAAAGRVGYGDRVSRIMYSRWYFFTRHRARTPGNLAAFVWTHTGETAQLTAVGLLRPGTGVTRLLRGVARGYKLCLKDLGRGVFGRRED